MRTIPLATLLAAIAACSSNSGSGTSAASVVGNYSVSITDGQNGCSIQNFTPGAMTTGVTVAVTQCGSQVCANVQGLAGVYLSLGVGTSTLTGTLNGNAATLTASATHTQGGCMYTTTATATATFDGNTMQGTITYTDSGGSGCVGAMQQCTSEQTFAGSRPPPSG
jgi:hypothetical protein